MQSKNNVAHIAIIAKCEATTHHEFTVEVDFCKPITQWEAQQWVNDVVFRNALGEFLIENNDQHTAKK